MPRPLQTQSTSVATDSLLRKQAEAPWVGGYFRMVRTRQLVTHRPDGCLDYVLRGWAPPSGDPDFREAGM